MRWTDGKAAQLNKAKEILAFELTKLVHGEEEATEGTGRRTSTVLSSGECSRYADSRAD